jgi:hypothetical protein
MAHTDRDHERVIWRNHDRVCNRWSKGGCCEVCDRVPRAWSGMCPIADSEWRRDCRREERAKARNVLQRARSGHLDWDDVTIGYRRPYYW